MIRFIGVNPFTPREGKQSNLAAREGISVPQSGHPLQDGSIFPLARKAYVSDLVAKQEGTQPPQVLQARPSFFVQIRPLLVFLKYRQLLLCRTLLAVLIQ